MLNSWDARRDYVIAGNEEATISFAAEHWIHSAKRAIQQKGRFAVALSGGSTPKAIYKKLSTDHKGDIDWNLVHLYWSDERAVPSDHPDSNYRMAMENGFKHLPIPASQIHRMKGETEIDKHAADYEELIRRHLGSTLFDLVMLGVGEDGHTASLFPHTSALDEETRLVTALAPPNKKEKRMTLTFPCLNQSAHTVFYALGTGKQAIVPIVLNSAIISPFPASRVGTPERKALWVLDESAAHLLNKKIE